MASLSSGAAILDTLRTYPDEFIPLDIFIAKDGVWHLHGKPIDPREVIKHADVVWNTLHGEYGEDGAIAHFIQTMGIPYIGSSPYTTSVTNNKELAKEHFRRLGVSTPESLVIEEGGDENDQALKVLRTIAPPWIIKPLKGACSYNVQLARTYSELVLALTHQKETYGDILVEQYIQGRELHLGLIQGFREHDMYETMLVEVHTNEPFLSSDMRAVGNYTHSIPKDIRGEEKDALIASAKMICTELGIQGCTSFDFIKTNRGTYLLEVDDIPELHKEGIFQKSLIETGVSLESVAKHLVERALAKNK
jgi:D-alanine--D-alanine ligase